MHVRERERPAPAWQILTVGRLKVKKTVLWISTLFVFPLLVGHAWAEEFKKWGDVGEWQIFVDASVGNGHAYFRRSPWVSSDILMSLMYDFTPSERGLTRRAGHTAWSFPKDYTERLRKELSKRKATPAMPRLPR